MKANSHRAQFRRVAGTDAVARGFDPILPLGTDSISQRAIFATASSSRSIGYGLRMYSLHPEQIPHRLGGGLAFVLPLIMITGNGRNEVTPGVFRGTRKNRCVLWAFIMSKIIKFGFSRSANAQSLGLLTVACRTRPGKPARPSWRNLTVFGRILDVVVSTKQNFLEKPGRVHSLPRFRLRLLSETCSISGLPG